MEIKYEERGSYLVMKFEKEKELVTNEKLKINSIIAEYFNLKSEKKGIIFDLKDLKFLKSDGISLLLHTYSELKSRGKKTHIVYEKNNQIKRIIKKFHIDNLLVVSESIDEIIE